MDIEEYSLAPFIEFYKKVFANETLKKSFIQHILYYLKNAKIDLNQPALPSKNQTKTLFSSIKTEKFLEYTREKGEIWLERMLAYQFIKYLQKNPDFFRQIVARHNKQ
jgi:hypothetical protein